MRFVRVSVKYTQFIRAVCANPSEFGEGGASGRATSGRGGGWKGERRSNLKFEIPDLRDGDGIEARADGWAEMQIPSKDSGQALPAAG